MAEMNATEREQWRRFFEQRGIDPARIAAVPPTLLKHGVVYTEIVMLWQGSRQRISPPRKRGVYKVRARLLPRKNGVY